MTQTASKAMREAAKEAIRKAGGASALAKELSARTGKPVKVERVQKWTVIGVAPLFVLHVSEISGIPPGRLRPEMVAQSANQ